MVGCGAHTALVMIEVLLAILLFGKLVISPAQRMTALLEFPAQMT